MRERRSDTVLAVVLALLLHAVPAVILLLAALWPAPEQSAAPGEPVVAAVVDIVFAVAAMNPDGSAMIGYENESSRL